MKRTKTGLLQEQKERQDQRIKYYNAAMENAKALREYIRSQISCSMDASDLGDTELLYIALNKWID